MLVFNLRSSVVICGCFCLSHLHLRVIVQREHGARALGIGQGIEVGTGRAGRVDRHDSGGDFFVVNPKAIGRLAHDQIEISRVEPRASKTLRSIMLTGRVVAIMLYVSVTRTAVLPACPDVSVPVV